MQGGMTLSMAAVLVLTLGFMLAVYEECGTAKTLRRLWIVAAVACVLIGLVL